jgi:non-specific serine/threonine protein kinase
MAAERAERGDYAAAERLFEESVPLMHETGDSYGVALALVEQGYLAAHQSRYGQSEELLERAFVRFTELGDKRRAARATMRRGVVAILRGDTFRGQELCRRGLAGFRDIDFLPGIGDCLEALASVEGIHGHGRQAAYLFGAVEALQERLGQAPSDAPADRTLRERGQRALARHLDSAAQATARATGRSAPLSRVVSVALLPAAEDFDHTAGAHGQSLTRREYEVAALIAAGLSDGQIAERLVVSRRTAHAHVRNILGKLGFASRVEIATWAIGHGLAHPAASI